MRHAWLCGLLLSAVGCYGASSDDDDEVSAGSSGSSSGATGGTSSGKGGSSSGGSSSGGTSSAGEGIPLQNLPLELGEASCGKIFECCSAEEIAANPALGEDEASCVVTFGGLVSLILAPIQDAVAGGRAQYDGVALEGCIAAMESATCAEARNGTSDPTAAQNCGEFLIPLVDLGGDCEQSFECIDGWCDVDAGSLCSPLKVDGAECAGDDECQSGYCDLLDGCGPEPASPDDNLCGGA